MKVGRRILRTTLIAGAALGLTAGGTALALSSGPAQAATACAAAWSSTAVYTAGNQASENGTNYTANWWTQGNNPATNNGGTGSGQPWTSNGACSTTPKLGMLCPSKLNEGPSRPATNPPPPSALATVDAVTVTELSVLEPLAPKPLVLPFEAP